MRHLIVYATTEGQTRKIARFAADRLTDAGHSVELLDAAAAGATEVDPQKYDRILLMGSVHAGGYQLPLAEFAKAHRERLKEAAFVSVSLSAADGDEQDRAGLERCLTGFIEGTDWTPAHVEHVAGAFRFTQYDFLKSLAMRYIAHTKGVTVDAHTDTEFTDWEAFGRFVDTWAAREKAVAPA